MPGSSASSLSRRRLLAAAGGAAATLAVPGFVSAQANTPIKLGSLLPRQGPFALQGEATTLGIKIAAKKP